MEEGHINMLSHTQRGAPDGTFPKSCGFILGVHLVKSPKKMFTKGREKLKGKQMNLLLITFQGIGGSYTDKFILAGGFRKE